MIRLTQIFVQQPRNSPNSVSIPYCQNAPRNSELNGLFQCQFQGVNPTTFVSGVQVGAPGTIPFGRNAPVSPPRSCPANPGGGVPDGTQLLNLTQNPGVPGNIAPANPPPASPQSPTAAAPNPSTPPPANVDAGDFRHQNGLDAQQLNAGFENLSTTSSCTVGETACVNGGFAQCVGGQFVVIMCPSGLRCVALPLVNSPGTSITCDTVADATARIAATGVTGGLTGRG